MGRCGLLKWPQIHGSSKYQFLPRPTGQREHGSDSNHKKRPQLLSTALQDSAIIQKIAGIFSNGGRTNHYPLALPNNNFLCTNSHDASRILHYSVHL